MVCGATAYPRNLSIVSSNSSLVQESAPPHPWRPTRTPTLPHLIWGAQALSILHQSHIARPGPSELK